MTERPILFSGPMVRALLDGSKTQTRRVIASRKRAAPYFVVYSSSDGSQPRPVYSADGERGHYIDAQGYDTEERMQCPFGHTGEQLWVRETWYCDDYRVQRGPYLKPDDLDVDAARDDGTLIYRASSGDRPYEADQPVWRPAIHMPRWASRITLEITGVRVQRLQDISEADAIAEGVNRFPVCRQDDDVDAFYRIGPVDNDSFPIARYAALWESINSPGSWGANPWVWAVEFKRVTP